MTKEELKSLIEKTFGNNLAKVNEMYLGSALPTILNEIVDMAGGEEPVTIDLSDYELRVEDTDVTNSVPSNYVPHIGDIIIFEGQKLIISQIRMLPNEYVVLSGTYSSPDDWDELASIKLAFSSNRWVALYMER